MTTSHAVKAAQPQLRLASDFRIHSAAAPDGARGAYWLTTAAPELWPDTLTRAACLNVL